MKRKETFKITHLYRFLKMLKFLCYKVQLIIQNIGNMIDYNHSLTHVMHSLLSYARWPVIIDDYKALAIEMWLWLLSHLGLQSKVWQCVNNYDYKQKRTTMPETSSKLCAYYLCEPCYQCPLFFHQNEIKKAGLISPPLQ